MLDCYLTGWGPCIWDVPLCCQTEPEMNSHYHTPHPLIEVCRQQIELQVLFSNEISAPEEERAMWGLVYYLNNTQCPWCCSSANYCFLQLCQAWCWVYGIFQRWQKWELLRNSIYPGRQTCNQAITVECGENQGHVGCRRAANFPGCWKAPARDWSLSRGMNSKKEKWGNLSIAPSVEEAAASYKEACLPATERK
jgi:hypothetical protein